MELKAKFIFVWTFVGDICPCDNILELENR